jgi:hypothetical protein
MLEVHKNNEVGLFVERSLPILNLINLCECLREILPKFLGQASLYHLYNFENSKIEEICNVQSFGADTAKFHLRL